MITGGVTFEVTPLFLSLFFATLITLHYDNLKNAGICSIGKFILI